MAKKLRTNPIYVAPAIFGWVDENLEAQVLDELNDRILDPRNIDHKIIIYERQVNGWFLDRALDLIEIEGNGFIVLLICMSYIEGIEQYIKGESSNGSSADFFVNSMKRIFGVDCTDRNYRDLYSEARCGLFHNGMVKGKIIIKYTYRDPINFIDAENIHLNPKLMLGIIKEDFIDYIDKLKEEGDLRNNFDLMFSIVNH